MTSDNTDLILRPITPGDMASTATQIHFRQLSGAESLSRRPSASAYTRSSLDLKAEIDDALLDHHSLLYANNRPPRVSRNVRCLRVSAVLGWTLSLALLVALVVSHSTAAPEIPRVDLGSNLRLDTWRQRFAGLKPAHGPESAITFDDDSSAISSSAATNKGEWAAPAPVGSVRSRVTIVSSFYRIDAGKKHRVSEYHEWLTNFLHSVELPIIFYCAPQMRSYVQKLRGDKPITIISDYETPFEMPPLEGLGGREWAVAQHKIDPEKHVHVPDVYGIWTAKPWIVSNATAIDPYRSEYFFWVDAGGFREAEVSHDFKALPEQLDKIYADVPSDTLVLASTTIPFEDGLDYVQSAKKGGQMDREDRLQGGWYGGKKEGIRWWYEETLKVTVLQAAMQRFSAKEQPVWTQAARLNWQRIYVQNMALRSGSDCGKDMWFAFEKFADGADCDIPAWSGPQYVRELEEETAARNGSAASRTGRVQKRLR